MNDVLFPKQKLSNAAWTAFHSEYAEAQKAIKHYDSHVAQALGDLRLSLESVNFIKRVWFSPNAGDPLTMAQKQCREALAQATILTLLHYAQADVSAVDGERRLRLTSTLPSGGYTDYCGGTLRVSRLKTHFERAMTRRGLEGFGMIDLALVHGSGDSEPRELGIHMHAISRPSFAAPASTLLFAGGHQSSTCKNKHGLAAIDVSMSSAPLTCWDVAKLAYYVTKLSCGLKQETRRATSTSHLYWTFEHALRALEVYSYVSPSVAIHAVGPFGEFLKRDCQDRFTRFLGFDPSGLPPIDVANTRRSWRRVYQDLEFDELTPFRIAQ